jgi:hypothetical protein
MTNLSAPTGAIDTPRTSLKERFASVPEGDYVRDVLALLLFATSLVLPTSYLAADAPQKDALFIGAIAISAIALVFPYAARFGLLPATWTVARTRAIRLLLAVPFVLLYLWYAVGAHLFTDDAPFGIGAAFALAGAGVALSAQARASELGPIDRDRSPASTARFFALILAALIAIGYIGSAIFIATQTDGKATALVLTFILVLAGGAAVAVPALAAVFKHTRAWISLATGYAIAITAFLYLTAKDPASVVPKFETAQFYGPLATHPVALTVGLGLFLFPAFAAVVSAPAFARVARRSSDLEQRLDLAAIVLRTMALLGALFALVHAGYAVLVPSDELRAYGDGFLADNIAAALTGVVIVVVALIALRSFNRNPGTSRAPITVALVLSAILALVLNALSPFTGLGIGQLLLLLAIPAIGAYALIGNKASRDFFAEASKTRPEPRRDAYEWTAASVVPRAEVLAAPGNGSPATPTRVSSAPAARRSDSFAPAGGTTGAVAAVAPVSGASPDVPATRSSEQREASVSSPVSGDSAFSPTTGGAPALSEPVAPGAAEPAPVGVTRTSIHQLGGENTESVQSASPHSEATQVIGEVPDDATVTASRVANSRNSESAPTETISRSEVLGLEEATTGSTVSAHGYSEAEALDPATPAIVLAKIAELAPELRPALAKNPSTYPALIEWLGQLGDPAVDAALAQRGH